MKRYLCPMCETGRRAPGRMSRDDVRRYCLPCSEKTGKLVELTCPARETQAQKTRQRATEKAKAKREKEREGFMLADGTDIRHLLRKLQYLKCWRYEGDEVAAAVRQNKANKNQETRHAKTSDEAAVGMLNSLAWQAAEALPHIAPRTNLELRHRSLLMASCCEYFNLDREEILTHARVTDRLTGRTLDLEAWKIKRSVLAMAQARGI